MKMISSETLNECLTLNTEVTEGKELVEKLSNYSDTLIQLNAYAPIRDETQITQTAYNSLSMEVEK